MLETERLVIRPLTHEQLIKYAKCDGSLESELQLAPSSRTISPELREALEETIIPNVANPNNNYLYCTIWTAILKAEQMMVGDICIYGEPNPDGAIEIGYGTYAAFQGRGLMTEFVKGMIDWAKQESMIRSIVASTLKTNIASFRILEKNQFIRTGETETLFYWKLDLHKTS